MDITAFREAFPEFSDTELYPNSLLEFWYNFGSKLLNEKRWGELLNEGLFLFTAHSIVVAIGNEKRAAIGATPGVSSNGILASKSAGGVSASYDTGSVSLVNAGNFNSTSYGRSFWQLSQIVGMGGYQV